MGKTLYFPPRLPLPVQSHEQVQLVYDSQEVSARKFDVKNPAHVELIKMIRQKISDLRVMTSRRRGVVSERTILVKRVSLRRFTLEQLCDILLRSTPELWNARPEYYCAVALEVQSLLT